MNELMLGKWLAEYDSAAEWCASRGLKGKPGDPLPANMGEPGALRFIQSDPEAFQERVRACAYSQAMEKTLREIEGRISNYLQCGGLFNPEMMNHEKVGRMLLDFADISRAVLKQAKTGGGQ